MIINEYNSYVPTIDICIYIPSYIVEYVYIYEGICYNNIMITTSCIATYTLIRRFLSTELGDIFHWL